MLMSIVKEIQHAAVEMTIPLPVLLRKCMVLAAALKNNDLKQWASHELNGYPTNTSDVIPDYRRLHAEAHGTFTAAGNWWWRDVTIPAAALQERARRFGETVLLPQPVAELQALADTDPTGSLSCPWPGELIQIHRNKIFADMQLVDAWQSLTNQALKGVLDAIRNRVLEFALALEDAAPDAGEAGAPPVPPETVTQLVHTIIVSGNVTNLAVGPHAVQVAVNVPKGDLPALIETLTGLGVSPAEISEFEAEAKDEEPVAGNLGPRAAGWLGKVTAKVTSGSLQLAKGIGVHVVTKAVWDFFGISK